MDKYQKQVDEWFQKKGWEYWDPLVILARLSEEVGEFARIVNDRHGQKSKRPEEDAQDIEAEIGDILFTLICYANAHDIDLNQSMEKSLNKVMDRDQDRWTEEDK